MSAVVDGTICDTGKVNSINSFIRFTNLIINN